MKLLQDLIICVLLTQGAVMWALFHINRKVNKMAVSQAQFDTDLAGFLTAFGNLITAIDNALANIAPADLSAEDTQIQAAAAAAAAELNKLNPPTPVPAPAPLPTNGGATA